MNMIAPVDRAQLRELVNRERDTLADMQASVGEDGADTAKLDAWLKAAGKLSTAARVHLPALIDTLEATDPTPWADYHGDIPDHDHALRPVFESGIQYAVELLAKELGVKEWTPCEGTEEFDGDLGGTMMNIVREALPENADGERLWPIEVAAALAQAVNRWPDIGADPMKGDRSDRYNAAAAACREAYVRQQPHVPDQTALVWRCHLGALLEDHLRLNVLLSRERPVDDATAVSANEIERQDAQRAMGLIAEATTLEDAHATAAAFLGGAA